MTEPHAAEPHEADQEARAADSSADGNTSNLAPQASSQHEAEPGEYHTTAAQNAPLFARPLTGPGGARWVRQTSHLDTSPSAEPRAKAARDDHRPFAGRAAPRTATQSVGKHARWCAEAQASW